MNGSFVRLSVLAIAGFFFAWLGTVPALAMEQHSKSRLTWDFDGDHNTDLAVGAVSGSTFTVHVQLSGRLKEVFLKTKVPRQLALNLSALDVDRDNDIDLVLTGFSFRPLAVWLNQGHGKFQKTSHWFFPPIYRDTSGQIRHAVRRNNIELASAVERPSVFFVAAPPVTLVPPGPGNVFPSFVCCSTNSSFREGFSRGPPL